MRRRSFHEGHRPESRCLGTGVGLSVYTEGTKSWLCARLFPGQLGIELRAAISISTESQHSVSWSTTERSLDIWVDGIVVRVHEATRTSCGIHIVKRRPVIDRLNSSMIGS